MCHCPSPLAPPAEPTPNRLPRLPPSLQAIVVTISAGLAASTLPGVSYYYIFQHDDSGLGPFAWAHWAVVFAACVLGLLAHALACKGEQAGPGISGERSLCMGHTCSTCMCLMMCSPRVQPRCPAHRPACFPCATALLATHVALCGMLGAALGGFDTAFWYQLATR